MHQSFQHSVLPMVKQVGEVEDLFKIYGQLAKLGYQDFLQR
jgi:hypothetical protein